MSVSPVLLMSREPATRNSVAEALASNGRLEQQNICVGLTELNARLERGPVPAALIDIDGESSGLLASLDPIVRRFRDTRFVVLSQEMKPELLLEAMQIGARHFMIKPSILGELTMVLNRLCPQHDAAHAAGECVTILSAGGGCGATTFAVNVANEIAQATTTTALIMDLDTCYGGVASYLGIDAAYGVHDLVARDGNIDAHLIQTTALGSVNGLSVLVSTSPEHQGEPLNVEPLRLREAIMAARQAFPYTVIDAPRVSMDIAATLAQCSVRTYVMFQLTVKDLAVARRTITGLQHRGVSRASIVALASRYRRRSALITLEEAKEALGESKIETIENDFTAVYHATVVGQVLAKSSPRSDARRDMKRLADTLVPHRH